MSEEVKELLAKIGEMWVMGNTLGIKRTFDKETEQIIVTIPDEPRRLVVDMDGAINWFNSELPEVV